MKQFNSPNWLISKAHVRPSIFNNSTTAKEILLTGVLFKFFCLHVGTTPRLSFSRKSMFTSFKQLFVKEPEPPNLKKASFSHRLFGLFHSIGCECFFLCRLASGWLWVEPAALWSPPVWSFSAQINCTSAWCKLALASCITPIESFDFFLSLACI